MRAEVHHRECPGPAIEWRNAIDRTLYLHTGNALLTVAPGGRVQIARDEFARAPRIAMLFHGWETRGLLRRSDP